MTRVETINARNPTHQAPTQRGSVCCNVILQRKRATDLHCKVQIADCARVNSSVIVNYAVHCVYRRNSNNHDDTEYRPIARTEPISVICNDNANCRRFDTIPACDGQTDRQTDGQTELL